MVLTDTLHLRGLEVEGHPDYESSSGELASGRPDTRDMLKDIATQMAGILALASSEDYRLPFVQSTARLFVSRPE